MKIVKYLTFLFIVGNAFCGSIFAGGFTDFNKYIKFENEIQKLSENNSFVRQFGISLAEMNLKKEIKRLHRKIEKFLEENESDQETIIELRSDPDKWSEWYTAEEKNEILEERLKHIERNLEKITELNEKISLCEELLLKVNDLK